MGFGIELLIAIMIFLTGARNDLLDLIPSDSYWHAKKITVTLDQLQRDAGPDQKIEGVDPLLADLASPEFKIRNNAKTTLAAMGPSILPQLATALASANPEVKAVAASLAIEFENKSRERSVRRLMAIRTLGERKEKEALPLLQSFANSQEMFVADYAARAVASLENKPWTPVDHSPSIQADFQLLPSHTGIVGQTTGFASHLPLLTDILDHIDTPNPNPGQQNPPLTKSDMLDRATLGLLQIAERIGNVRLDGLTTALSDDAGENSGWEITILRGQFDRESLIAAAKVLAHPIDGPVRSFQIGGIDVVQTDVDTAIMFPSDQLAIIVMTDEEKDRNARMLALAVALKNGHGTLNANTELTALLKTVDTTAPLWLAGKFNPEEQKVKLFEGFDTVALAGKREKGALTVTINGSGPDPVKIKSSLDEINTDLQWIKQILPPSRSFTPIANLLTSLHLTSDAKSVTLTGQLKDDLAGAVLSNVAPFILTEIKPAADNAPAPQPLAIPR